MANRSTFNSRLPRDIKRLLDLTPGDKQYINSLRGLFIDAHRHHKAFKLQRLDKQISLDLKSDIANTASQISTT
jgi:hypothetical protein